MKTVRQCENCKSWLRGSCALEVEEWELDNGNCDDYEQKTSHNELNSVISVKEDMTDEEMDLYL